MLTEKDYCDYDTCVALKELGFPQDYIFARYAEVDKWVDYTSHKKGDLIISEDRFAFTLEDESIVAPLLYEAQKWLREENGIEIVVLSKGMVGSPYYSQVYTEDYAIGGDEEYSTYEEALLGGIKEAVKIFEGGVIWEEVY